MIGIMVVYRELLPDLDVTVAKEKERCKFLINQGIWDSISASDVDRWIENFKSEEGRLLAVLLLSQFIYRSPTQTASLMEYAIGTCLPHALAKDPWDSLSQPNFKDLLSMRRTESRDFAIVPIIRDDEPPTKSGPAIARFYRRYVNLAESLMIWPWKIGEEYEKGCRVFILIDDVVATGEQFNTFYRTTLEGKYDKAKFVYVPLVAHEGGIEEINNIATTVSICPVERLSAESSFFNRKPISKISDIRALYDLVVGDIFNQRFLKGKLKYGLEGLATTLSFSHATPNCTIPLYWYQSDIFHPLVKR